MVDASNATLVVERDGVRAVYKPVRGERPLWDFPDGTLGRREVAAYEVSRRLGWDVVPVTTWIDDGPLGAGSLQEWVDHGDHLVGVFPAEAVPGGWLPVLDAVDRDETPLTVAHADTDHLQRLAVFDLLVNNTDRKGGHILAPGPSRVAGIDNGLCFHTEPKLRTVVWGFAGRAIPAELLADLTAARSDLPDLLVGLADAEKQALSRRLDDLLATPVFPHPGAGPVIPWPPL